MSLRLITNHFERELWNINTLHGNSDVNSKAFAALLLVEEMSELTKEIVKQYVRGKDNSSSLDEEIADVILLLDQLVRLRSADDISEALKKKIARYHQRYGARK